MKNVKEKSVCYYYELPDQQCFTVYKLSSKYTTDNKKDDLNTPTMVIKVDTDTFYCSIGLDSCEDLFNEINFNTVNKIVFNSDYSNNVTNVTVYDHDENVIVSDNFDYYELFGY